MDVFQVVCDMSFQDSPFPTVRHAPAPFPAFPEPGDRRRSTVKCKIIINYRSDKRKTAENKYCRNQIKIVTLRAVSVWLPNQTGGVMKTGPVR